MSRAANGGGGSAASAGTFPRSGGGGSGGAVGGTTSACAEGGDDGDAVGHAGGYDTGGCVGTVVELDDVPPPIPTSRSVPAEVFLADGASVGNDGGNVENVPLQPVDNPLGDVEPPGTAVAVSAATSGSGCA